jgi:hypothetical protein
MLKLESQSGGSLVVLSNFRSHSLEAGLESNLVFTRSELEVESIDLHLVRISGSLEGLL